MKNRNKRAQHEIVGFILIVIIVVIIGLFMLVIYLRQPAPSYKSLDVQNFLEASMLYTTGCVTSIEPVNMQDLIKSCKNNRKCLNNEMACKVLEKEFEELVHESWLVSEEGAVKAYFLRIYYEEDEIKEELLELQEGNCTGTRIGAEHLIHQYPGNIIISMEICHA